MMDQTYRKSIVKYLSEYLGTNTCWKLLLGADDDEIAASITPFEKEHTTLKARHIVDALHSMINAIDSNLPITWLQCYENSCVLNYKQVQRPKTIAEWYFQLHKTIDMKFIRSRRGRQTNIAKSPFSENEELTISFKMWARSDIENLSILKAHNFINNKLLVNWTAAQLANNKITFPVSLHVVS